MYKLTKEDTFKIIDAQIAKYRCELTEYKNKPELSDNYRQNYVFELHAQIWALLSLKGALIDHCIQKLNEE